MTIFETTKRIITIIAEQGGYLLNAGDIQAVIRMMFVFMVSLLATYVLISKTDAEKTRGEIRGWMLYK